MRFSTRPQSKIENKKNPANPRKYKKKEIVNLFAENKVSLIIQLDKNGVHDRKIENIEKSEKEIVVNKSIADLFEVFERFEGNSFSF